MRKTLIIGSAFAGALVLAAAPITTMKMRQAMQVYSPVANDSVNPQGEKFGVANILREKISTDFSKVPTEVITADSDTLFLLDAPQEGMYLYMLQTTLRAPQFTKGVLTVNSPARFEVLVNGEKKATKTSTEDSISASGLQRVNLTFNPEETKVVTVKLLAEADAAKPVLKVDFTPDNGYENVAMNEGAEIKNRFTLATTIVGKRVDNTAISPDGKYLLTKYSDAPEPTKKYRSATLTDIKTGKVVGRVNPDALWMPKGSTLYFTQENANGFDIYSIQVPSLQQTLICENAPAAQFTWSPNLDYFIYYDINEGVKETSPLRRYVTPDDRIKNNRTRYFLKKYDVATGLIQTLTTGTGSTVLADISADGKKLLYSTTRETPDTYPFYSEDLLQMTLPNLAVDTLIKNNGYFGEVTYSPDATKVFVVGSPRTFGDLGVNCAPEPIPNDYDKQGFIFDIATRTATAATRDFNPSLKGYPVWNAADNNIYFLADDGFYRNLYALNPTTLKIKQLNDDTAVTLNFSIGNNESNWLSYSGVGDDYCGRAYLMNLKTGKSTLIDDPMSATMDKIELGKTEKWNFTDKDGCTIEGTYTLPPNFDPNKKYPMIVYYYGGTSPSQYGMTHPYVPQLFAARDYVVYVLNPSGTTAYGQEFSARHVNAWGKRTADEIIEGVKKFTEEHPFVDKDKIGCLGASYGGFMTQYLQTQTDIFAAAVSHAGISNVTSYWGEGYWGYSYNSVAAAESYPWTNPDLYTKQGSLFNADKIHTPLLLLHGTADTNVPIGESIQLFNALKILGRDVEFISVADEDHISGYYPYEKRLLWHDTIMAWFEKWLKGDSKWWNEMYPERHL
jgi:dipeptidyl aminopeptidase/acylaminoacyl peptidase